MPLPTDDRLMRAADDVHNLMAPDTFAEMTIAGGVDNLNDNDANSESAEGDGDDSCKRKVRHNLTERRRVDRMNQLFKKVRAPDRTRTHARAACSLPLSAARHRSPLPWSWRVHDRISCAHILTLCMRVLACSCT